MGSWISAVRYRSPFYSTHMIQWLTHNWIELIGTIAGLVYIVLEVRQRASMWIVGIITSAMYIVVFFQSKFYADMALQIYYVAISIYGWYMWKHGGIHRAELTIQKLRIGISLVLLVISVLLFYLISYILIHFTDSPVPYGDAFTTALSIVATWMLAHKYIEQWLVWIIINIVSAYLYWNKELYATVLLFTVYTILAIVGYSIWRRSYNKK